MHLVDETQVFLGLARCLKPGGVYVFNLWWHSWQPTAQASYDHVWKPVVEQVLQDMGEAQPTWSSSSRPRVRTLDHLRRAAQAAGFRLEQVITDTDQVRLSFFTDFSAMSSTFLDHLSAQVRQQALLRIHERATSPVDIQTTRFCIRRCSN